MTTQRQSTLLRLPTKLRNKIYDFAFNSAVIRYFSEINPEEDCLCVAACTLQLGTKLRTSTGRMDMDTGLPTVIL